MRLSISNIGWSEEQDRYMYEQMKEYGYTGLEIAPTRIFPDAPYEKILEAAEWMKQLRNVYDFHIPSMQSIWYGRQESIFGTEEEREILLDYTKKAIDFASVIDCHNLVFGCPRNRNMPENASIDVAVRFFREIGNYALEKGTVIGMEANPTIYNTNFINTTCQAFELIKQVNSDGFKLNLDMGTIIQNEEEISELKGRVNLINHVHISEPGLKPIQERNIHRELKNLLVDENYQGYVSIEMAKTEEVSITCEKMKYIRSVFKL